MLVLSRKIGESVVIGGNITVTITRVAGNRVMVGIDAPDSVRVVRGELGALKSVPTTPAAVSEAPSTDIAPQNTMSRPGLDEPTPLLSTVG